MPNEQVNSSCGLYDLSSVYLIINIVFIKINHNCLIKWIYTLATKLLSKKTLACPANIKYFESFTTLALINAWAFFLGTASYSNSGFKLIIPIDTLCVLLSDGIVELRGISNVLVEPILLFSTYNWIWFKSRDKIKWYIYRTLFTLVKIIFGLISSEE